MCQNLKCLKQEEKLEYLIISCIKMRRCYFILIHMQVIEKLPKQIRNKILCIYKENRCEPT